MSADIELLKARLASLEGFDVKDNKETWPVGEWAIEALSYIVALETKVRNQDTYLRMCARPIIMRNP
jgi:hypothetical protein